MIARHSVTPAISKLQGSSIIALRWSVCLLVLIALAGCNGLLSQGPVVPDQPTAREQTRVADEQLRDAQRMPNPQLRQEEFRKAAAAFRKVVERFPNDRTYTPAAHLVLGDVYYQMERFGDAEGVYREVIRRYPDISDIHAGALYGMGEVLTARGRGRAGKEYYRQLIDIYGESDDPVIRDRVTLAQRKYDRILD